MMQNLVPCGATRFLNSSGEMSGCDFFWQLQVEFTVHKSRSSVMSCLGFNELNQVHYQLRWLTLDGNRKTFAG